LLGRLFVEDNASEVVLDSGCGEEKIAEFPPHFHGRLDAIRDEALFIGRFDAFICSEETLSGLHHL